MNGGPLVLTFQGLLLPDCVNLTVVQAMLYTCDLVGPHAGITLSLWPRTALRPKETLSSTMKSRRSWLDNFLHKVRGVLDLALIVFE